MNVKHLISFIISLFLTLLIVQSADAGRIAQDSKGAPVHSIHSMLEGIMPSVVNIRAIGKMDASTIISNKKDSRSEEQGNPEATPYSLEPHHFESIASGVIIDAKKGYIITNAHVIDHTDTITVSLKDGRQFTAKKIGSDPASDVAVIQIKGDNLKAAKLGDSNSVQVGDFVAAIGNPFGLNQTVTSGIISALERSDLGIEGYENFIQTDAPINPGNSGGVLVNLKGEVIGINTAIITAGHRNGGNVGIGLAIPINMAKSVEVQLVKYGKVERGMLGIYAQNITPLLANALHLSNTKGAIISKINPASPAQLTGLKAGDVILSIDGKTINTAADVRNTIGLMRIGTKVRLDILRNGKTIHLSETLVDPEKHTDKLRDENPFLFGLALQDYNEVSPIHGPVQGVLVLHVADDTPAWQAYLRPGDVIITANEKIVKHSNELQAIAKASKKYLVLNVLRGNAALFLVINNTNTHSAHKTA